MVVAKLTRLRRCLSAEAGMPATMPCVSHARLLHAGV